MEYRNHMHAPRLTEMDFRASTHLHPQSHPLSGILALPLEDNVASWSSFLSSSGSNVLHMISSYTELPGYISGMPSGSFVPSLVERSNPMIQSLHQAPIPTAAYDTRGMHQNNLVVNNGGRLKRKRSDGRDLEMGDPLRHDSHGNSMGLPVHIGCHPGEDSTRGSNYWNSGFTDQAPSVYGQRNMRRRVSSSFDAGFGPENSRGSSMCHFYSARYHLNELHNEQLSDVRRATSSQGLRQAPVPYRRISFPDNALNIAIHHVPALVSDGNCITYTNERNLPFIMNSVIPPQNLHATSIEPTGSGHTEFLRGSVAAQRPASGYRFHSNAASGTNTTLYGSQSRMEPYVPLFRFSRPLSSIQEHNSNRFSLTTGSASGGSRINAETTARARLYSEGAAVPDGFYYGSEYPIDHHRDMHLDIDRMSYEELLALEEYIGDVCTGLPENIISRRLKKKTFINSDEAKERLETDGTCSICQEEHDTNDELGILDCGHDYHYSCIKQWLLLKNVCPICKATALGDAPDR